MSPDLLASVIESETQIAGNRSKCKRKWHGVTRTILAMRGALELYLLELLLLLVSKKFFSDPCKLVEVS